MRISAIVFLAALAASADPKPVPRMQAVPLPGDEVSLQRDGAELCRLHFSKGQRRPFIFPVIGPTGRSLTRMGHPHDPEGHSHHNSVWLSHEKAGGVNFWGDRAGKEQKLGRIEHLRVLRFEDADDSAFVETENAWLGPDGAAGCTNGDA
jgi:Methane oxygenase PmoA